MDSSFFEKKTYERMRGKLEDLEAVRLVVFLNFIQLLLIFQSDGVY